MDKVNEEVTIQVPSPKLSTFGATYQFKAPLPLPGFLANHEGSNEDEEETQDNDQPAGADEMELENFGDVTLNAAVTGGMTRQKQPYIVQFEDGTEEEIQVSFSRYNGPLIHLLITM